jgi:hypothetical protein
MTDGRDTVHDAIASARAKVCDVDEVVARKIIHDDSGNPEHRSALADQYRDFDVIGGDRVGFGGAIARAWAHVVGLPIDWVFHLEDDFVLNREVDLDDMALVLDGRPHLHQMALRRQPWNPEEAAAGGIVEQHPDDYVDHTDGLNHWLEHRRFFTTNPSLYRRSLCRRDWPTGPHSEGHFSIDLFRDPAATCGFWGARNSGEWVTHIGHERVGTGY